MKKSIFTIITALCTILVVSSCQSEVIYTCDKEANQWIKENLSAIQTMDRSDWVKLDERVKRGCFNAFTPKQRADFWINKFNETLRLDWAEEEANHIKAMLNFVSSYPNYFDFSIEKTDEEIEFFELFIYNWKDKAKNELKWKDELIYNMIASGNEILNKEGKVKQSETRVLASNDCSCSNTSDWCPIGTYCKYDHVCSSSTHGCGSLFVYECNGLCVPMYVEKAL